VWLKSILIFPVNALWGVLMIKDVHVLKLVKNVQVTAMVLNQKLQNLQNHVVIYDFFVLTFFFILDFFLCLIKIKIKLKI
jgi:hypothetical protein